jgi:hypothetical protein
MKPAAPKPRLPAVVASLALASTLLLSGCASTGVAQKKPLSDEQAIYATTGTYRTNSTQEAGKQSAKNSSASDKFFADFLGRFVVGGLVTLAASSVHGLKVGEALDGSHAGIRHRSLL